MNNEQTFDASFAANEGAGTANFGGKDETPADAGEGEGQELFLPQPAAQSPDGEEEVDGNTLEAEEGPQADGIEIGDKVTALVTGIAEYGVFVTTTTGHRGLIHISEISDWFVEDARDYFVIGEELQVEVISQEEGTGKYAFSTRRLGGKQPVGDGYTRRLMSFQAPLERSAPERRYHAPRRGHLPSGQGGSPREHDEITTFLQQRVGEVSEEARLLLLQLVGDYGPVRVALALADVTRRFDRSLALVNWVARTLEQDEPYAAGEPRA